MSASVAEVEAKLRAAMDEAKTMGLKIICGRMFLFVPEGRLPVGVDPLGAVSITYPNDSPVVILNIDASVAGSIASGFDGRTRGNEWADLGARLRRDYIDQRTGQ